MGVSRKKGGCWYGVEVFGRVEDSGRCGLIAVGEDEEAVADIVVVGGTAASVEIFGVGIMETDIGQRWLLR